MKIQKASEADKTEVLNLLDEFRADCIFQITGEEGHSDSAIKQGVNIYEELLDRPDYGKK